MGPANFIFDVFGPNIRLLIKHQKKVHLFVSRNILGTKHDTKSGNNVSIALE